MIVMLLALITILFLICNMREHFGIPETLNLYNSKLTELGTKLQTQTSQYDTANAQRLAYIKAQQDAYNAMLALAI